MEKRYAHLLQQYLEGEGEAEEVLYQLSLLGTRLIMAGYGPEDVVALHSELLERLPQSLKGEQEWVQRSMTFLLEVMIAYGVRHREQIQYELEESERRANQRAAIALAEAEERLRQNRQRLQDRDDFVGFIAHELRRPLTTIQGKATLGQRYVGNNEKTEDAFRAIYRAASQMSETLDLLLQLSRQERDYSVINANEVHLAALLYDSVNEFQMEQRAKRLSLTLDIEPPEPVVRGDEAGLRTVFDNLLSNAIKYSNPEGEVTVRTRHLQDWVQIEIEDTGIGIPPEELPHIFNRYYRIKTAGERTSGSGLGLALVEYIVHQHGGHISVTSKVGQGSRFVVQLPHHQSAASTNGQQPTHHTRFSQDRSQR